MENTRRNTFLRAASKALSAIESAALAATATFATILWVGIALPGLPLVPGLGGGNDRNVAISLDSALLGIKDRTGVRADATGRQARLASLLLPARSALTDGLAAARSEDSTSSAKPVVVTLPPS